MAPDPDVEVGVDDPSWPAALPDCHSVCLRAARAAAVRRLDRRPAEVAIMLADDEAVRMLNRTYRDKDKPTNVLSFPGDGEPFPGQPRMLGDVVLAFGTVTREAEEQGKPLADHLSHLVVHGVLHLLGYDHEDDADADEMERLEVEILAGLGIANPYEEDCVRRRDAVDR